MLFSAKGVSLFQLETLRTQAWAQHRTISVCGSGSGSGLWNSNVTFSLLLTLRPTASVSFCEKMEVVPALYFNDQMRAVCRLST